MSKRTILLLAIGAIAALVVGWQVIAFAGPVGTASGFEDDDGNLAPQTPINFDWNSFNPTTWTGTAPNRTSSKTVSGWKFTGLEDAQAIGTDSGFAGGTKQDQNCPSVIGAKAPNKDDLRRIYLSTKNVGGNIFLNLAWVRIPQNTTSSSAHVAFEFNKGSTSCGAGSGGLVQRTAGDMLIVYDFEGGGNTPVLTLRRWVTSGPCEISSNSAPCWGTATNLTAGGFAEARVNTSGSVVDTIGPTTPQTLGNSEFGEAGINLTAAGVFTPGGCEAFGKAFAVSRSSGNSGTAQMKDLVGPGNFTLSNCATVITRKVTDPSGDTTTNFGYTTNVTTTPSTTTSPFTLKDGQSKTITNVNTGTNLHVTEDNPGPNYQLTSINCNASTVPAANRSTNTTTRAVTFSIAAGETLDCTFTNTKQQGHILIDKVTDPIGDPESFAFTLTGGPSNLGQNFSLTDEDTPHDSGAILPGSGYDASETVPEGWDLSSATCDSGESNVHNITVEPNETVTCTFTNTKRGHILIDKVTDPSGDPQSFAFTLTGGPDNVNQSFSLTDEDPARDSGAVKPGSYSAAETVPPGWNLDQDNTSCDNGSPVDNISLSAGETVTCTFTNVQQRGNIVIDKVTNPSGDPQSFAFTLTGGPSDLNQSFPLTHAATPHDSGAVLAGDGYNAEESVPNGWDLTSATCDDGSEVDNIDVSTGETVTCTFTNTKKTTSISTSQSFTPQDTVTIGGTGSGTFNGQVDFELYKGTDCTGTPVYFERNVSLPGDGTLKTTNGDPENLPNHSAPYTISGEGTGEYHWKVSYHDDTSGHPDETSCVEKSTVTIDNDINTP